jgi:hypothetical protein
MLLKLDVLSLCLPGGPPVEEAVSVVDVALLSDHKLGETKPGGVGVVEWFPRGSQDFLISSGGTGDEDMAVYCVTFLSFFV